MKIPDLAALCSFLYICSSIFPPAKAAASLAPNHRRRRCAFGDSCWPNDAAWKAFNKSISGRLIRTFPSATVCHGKQYNAALCETAKKHWTDGSWRTNQTGGYSSMLWELGTDGECSIDTERKIPCNAGWVPHFSVAAQEVRDIQASVRFADKNDLYLVVKNTGHDHLGRSSGKGAFSVWTHYMKGKEWHKNFVPKGAPTNTSGTPAVTLYAGEQLQDVYAAAAEHGVIIVMGSAQTVGGAGGYFIGGGHSPFAHFYGLAADNVLEVNLVDANGEYRTINQYTDHEYFYALRGGGGNSWGVIVSVTMKTYPNPSHIQVGLVQLNATKEDALRTVLEHTFPAISHVAEAGYVGYASLGNGKSPIAFDGFFIQPNATSETFSKGFRPFINMISLEDVDGHVLSFDLPSWAAWCHHFLGDPNMATNMIEGSRLLTPEVLTNRSKDIVSLILKNQDYDPGFAFIGRVNSQERDNTGVHDIWKESAALMTLGADWNDDAPREKILKIKEGLVEVTEKLGKIVGENGGTYVNQANPYERDWQKVFWGQKYDKLLAVKQRIDPSNLFVCNRCVGSDIVLEP